MQHPRLVLALVLTSAAVLNQLSGGILIRLDAPKEAPAAAYRPGPPLADSPPLLNPEPPPLPPLPPRGRRHFQAALKYRYWGEAGERWHPAGPFMDFSYAGEWCRVAP